MGLILDSQPLPLQADADGVIRVGGTRVTLDTVVTSFCGGSTPEQIAQDFPVLELMDIYAAVAFYLRNREGVDAYLNERRRLGKEIRREIETHFDPHGIRDRLLARRVVRESGNGVPSR